MKRSLFHIIHSLGVGIIATAFVHQLHIAAVQNEGVLHQREMEVSCLYLMQQYTLLVINKRLPDVFSGFRLHSDFFAVPHQ